MAGKRGRTLFEAMQEANPEGEPSWSLGGASAPTREPTAAKMATAKPRRRTKCN